MYAVFADNVYNYYNVIEQTNKIINDSAQKIASIKAEYETNLAAADLELEIAINTNKLATKEYRVELNLL